MAHANPTARRIGAVMDDLVTWLSGCLDEDERVALIASEQAHPVAVYYLTQADISGPALDDDLRLDNATARYVPRLEGGLVLESKDARLVYSPARVLAEVEAKRVILDRHQPRYFFGISTARCLVCRDLTNAIPQRELGAVWPCLDVQVLALPYRDRPGWRPEWAPEPA